MKMSRMLAVALLAVPLVACTGVQDAPKQTAGTVLGAAGGGLLGAQLGGRGASQLAATAAGTLAGAVIGGEIGRSLDRADQLHAQQATQRALEASPTGTATTWRNPDTGHYGTVTPIRTYETAGRDCREFRHEVVMQGRPEVVYGTACRHPDGTWRIAEL